MRRWKYSVLTAAAVASIGLYTQDALALALGRATVLSKLGQPLRAEIDIAQASPDEIGTLRASIASGEIYSRHGVDYPAAANGVVVRLNKRPDGRHYLLLTSDNTVHDPFIDLVLDATWDGGSIVRTYTLLFDPPVTPAPITATAVAPRPPALQGDAATAAVPDAGTRPRTSARRPPPEPATSYAQGGQVLVERGDTAGRIAAAHKPADVSLDQMLVALQRANPHAFIRNNVNLVKAGAVLTMPDAEEVRAISPAEARSAISVQTQDFNRYRQEVAGKVQTTPAAVPGSATPGTGTIGVVKDGTSPDVSTDRVEVAQAPADVKEADRIAAEQKRLEDQKREEEIKRNLDELKTALDQTPVKAEDASGIATPDGTGGTPSSGDEGGLNVTPPPGIPAEGSSGDDAAAVEETPPTPEPAPPPPPPTPPRSAPPPPPPPPEPGFLESLLGNKLLLGGVGAAILAVLALLLVRKRKKSGGSDDESGLADSSFMAESRLPSDSFFGASGGAQVDTGQSLDSVAGSSVLSGYSSERSSAHSGSGDSAHSDSGDSSLGGSSMMYSPSQLDTGGDVDPVAEAEVYLAYGRDMQAEEILREALTTTPAKAAPIYSKLADIYAMRRDAKAFEAMALEAQRTTGGAGEDWAHIVQLGGELDPGNPLYEAGGDTKAFAASRLPPAQHDDTVPGMGMETTHAADLEITDPAPLTSRQSTQTSPQGFSMDDIPKLDDAVADAVDSAAMDFDLDSLSLDMDGEPTAPGTLEELKPAAAPSTGGGEDHLATKLALAEEFNAIGDVDGARALVEEVLAESSGDLHARAQRMLSSLG